MVLSYAFIYIPWFCYLEKTVTRNYHVMHVALDDFIPFNEYFIVPYMMWFLYVAGTILYFLFTNREDYYRICIFLFSGMTISLIICTFFRNGTDFRPVLEPGKNIFTTMVAALVEEGQALILNEGDSRAYHLSEEGGIVRVTRDHSLVEDLVEQVGVGGRALNDQLLQGPAHPADGLQPGGGDRRVSLAIRES